MVCYTVLAFISPDCKRTVMYQTVLYNNKYTGKLIGCDSRLTIGQRCLFHQKSQTTVNQTALHSSCSGVGTHESVGLAAHSEHPQQVAYRKVVVLLFEKNKLLRSLQKLESIVAYIVLVHSDPAQRYRLACCSVLKLLHNRFMKLTMEHYKANWWAPAEPTVPVTSTTNTFPESG